MIRIDYSITPKQAEMLIGYHADFECNGRAYLTKTAIERVSQCGDGVASGFQRCIPGRLGHVLYVRADRLPWDAPDCFPWDAPTETPEDRVVRLECELAEAKAEAAGAPEGWTVSKDFAGPLWIKGNYRLETYGDRIIMRDGCESLTYPVDALVAFCAAVRKHREA
jgi:hypothetical protein